MASGSLEALRAYHGLRQVDGVPIASVAEPRTRVASRGLKSLDQDGKGCSVLENSHLLPPRGKSDNEAST